MPKSDYKRYKFYKFVAYAALASVVIIAAGLLFGWIIMLLWNATIAELFGVSMISFWQALGLFILAKLFFGVGSTPGRHKSKDGEFRWAKFKDKSVRYQGFRKYWDEEGRDAYKRFQATGNDDANQESG
ncbi:MAG: hypothetical protein ACJAYE_002589 [Candidatus Azotimanducaceae bacterium]|jgi:hypothetical protein